MTYALEGITVIDLSQSIAGPYCTKLLAIEGAEVIKVEPPGAGDTLRRMGPFVGDDPHPEKSIPFLYLNTSKKSITLNFQNSTGRKMLMELVKEADVLVEGFEPSHMPSLGLGYETLEKLNPRLVMVSISHFGQTGPYRDYKGEEIVDQAISGHVSITGEPDREPLKMGGNLGQYAGGQAAYASTLMALYHATLTGEGQRVDNSIVDANADLLDSWGLNSLFDGVPKRLGNIAPGVALRGRGGLYETKDGWIAMGQVPGGWDAFADMVGIEELKDPKYTNPATRGEYQDELEAIVEPWVREHTKLEIYHASQARRNAIGYVATPEDMFSSPQLEARNFFQEIDHPVAGRARYPGLPFQLYETEATIARAPLLGEHNTEVYGKRLGLERKEIVRLSQLGII